MMDEMIPSFGKWFDEPGVEQDMNMITIMKDGKLAGYKLQYAVPGFTKDDVSVSIDNGVIRIEAQRKESDETDGDHYEYRGIAYRNLSTSYRCSENIDCDAIECGLENGILTIIIPLKNNKNNEVKKIEIK